MDIKELIKTANMFDEMGMREQADIIDDIIVKIAAASKVRKDLAASELRQIYNICNKAEKQLDKLEEKCAEDKSCLKIVTTLKQHCSNIKEILEVKDK